MQQILIVKKLDNIYLFIVIVLVMLAVIDLMVGVSNDAVNFLNSAVGSKVTSRRVILIVASLGIFIGTLTSNGMMEIARQGIFHPGMFTFHDVMIIFLAVMICDVVLLDMFNTFGLPTSTTVSLIFELLGAAILVALFKIWTEPGAVGDLSLYINSARALTMISAILASVVVAFICGSVVMFVSRILFSFRYKRAFRRFGAMWCGLSLTAIAYFAIFKGLKDSTIISMEMMAWFSNNIRIISLSFFVASTVIMGILQFIFKVNILKIIILAGTGALALAFAGNDLVNFIGVTMAGIDSYGIASASGNANMTMEALMEPVRANPGYLLIAGAVMVFALWFSRKAQTVTDTEVNLARQGDGVERFGSSTASRTLVRSAMSLNKQFSALLPDKVNQFIDSRFKQTNYDRKHQAAFDQIRASVNLTVAALLIAFATSLRLPLSTTYVTFMVAMATSLSDRAWGRESAVYRITGVLTVVSGWFITAIVAFSSGAIVALLLMWGGKIAMAPLLILCVFMLVNSVKIHRRREKKHLEKIPEQQALEKSSLIFDCNEDIYNVFEQMSRIYSQTLHGLALEDRKKLKKLYKEATELYHKEKERRVYEMLPTLNKLHEDAVDTGHYYVQVNDYLYEVSKSLMAITKGSFEYIDNNHEGLSPKQMEGLQNIEKSVSEVYASIVNMLRTSDFTDFEQTLAKRDDIFDLFVENIKSQIKRIKSKESTTRNSMLFLEIVSETKTMMLQARNMMRAQRLFLGHEEVEKNKERNP